MVEPWTDDIALVSHVLPRTHAKDVIHLFHRDDLTLRTRHEKPNKQQGKGIKAAALIEISVSRYVEGS